MRRYTNYPILISDGMNPFSVTVGFRCGECGQISEDITKHKCKPIISREKEDSISFSSLLREVFNFKNKLSGEAI
ncbi:hypothetical protein C0584_03855 [Candidatus Parcubacteria bacterium]|nr:MAG: hypothetical protein C0584_03855 [Candidatus Parcubacteria bacterium]